MTVQRKPKDPTSGNGTSTGRNWCRQCGGTNACYSWCPTKSTGKRG